MTAKSDLETFAPKVMDHILGKRIFSQKPLTLRATGTLVAAIAEEVQKAAATSALNALMEVDVNDTAGLVSAVLSMVRGIPDALPRLIAIMLTGAEKPEDVAFIDENCGLVAATKVVRCFVEQNEPQELIENFFALRATLTTAIADAKAKVG